MRVVKHGYDLFMISGCQPLISSVLWQATKCPGDTSLNSGMDSAHFSVAYWHLVLKGHPEGAFRGLGISPDKAIRLFALAIFGSGTGTADISDLVYGWSG